MMFDNSLYQPWLQALQSKGSLSASEIKKVERMQKSNVAEADNLPLLLIKLGLCSEQDVADAFVSSGHFEKVAVSDYPVERQLPDTVSLRFLKNYHLVGLSDSNETMIVAAVDPIDKFVLNALRLATSKTVTVKVGLLSEIDAAIAIQYGEQRSKMDKLTENMEDNEILEEELEHLKDLASEAPVIRIVNLIIQRAIEMRASDIHIEPFEDTLKIRLRVDGVLQHIEAPPITSTAAVVSRIKIMAKLNIAERRLPQDGRIKIQMLGKELDLRVSTVPTLYGESVVIRLLSKDDTVLDFAALGFSEQNSQHFAEILTLPHGIILITGPTGSGKSTTLYTALKQLNTSTRKIITVEDPIEYQIEGINQIQVKPKIGLTFANALRSIVRQDPDVIMIGEMRDLETARIAVQSALTGHTVLSTLHTNDAATGITRLLDMGVENYLLTSTINGILAQRLVRKLCDHCKQAYPASSNLVENLNLQRFAAKEKIILYHSVGCDECNGLGYRGRLAIIEFLFVSSAIRSAITCNETATSIKKLAISEGMLTLYEDGLSKVTQGLTTLEEVLRVTTDT